MSGSLNLLVHVWRMSARYKTVLTNYSCFSHSFSENITFKMPSKQTYYNLEWEDKKIHPNLSEWIRMGKYNKYFCCKVCNTGSLKLVTMGIGAPMNHMKTNKDTSSVKTKHERNLAIIRSSQSISALVPKRTENPNNIEPKQAENAITDIQLPTCSTTQKAIIPAFSSPANVKAEIVLAMKSATSHLSASKTCQR